MNIISEIISMKNFLLPCLHILAEKVENGITNIRKISIEDPYSVSTRNVWKYFDIKLFSNIEPLSQILESVTQRAPKLQVFE